MFCFYSLQGKLKQARDGAVGFRCAMPVLGAAFGMYHRPFRGLLWTHFLAWPHAGFAPRPHTPHMLQRGLVTMAVPLTDGLTQDIGRKAVSWVRGLQPPCGLWGDWG